MPVAIRIFAAEGGAVPDTKGDEFPHRPEASSERRVELLCFRNGDRHHDLAVGLLSLRNCRDSRHAKSC